MSDVTRLLLTATTLLLLAGLVACGQKGPLRQEEPANYTVSGHHDRIPLSRSLTIC
ncbi:LPS translocon maturation chaperone LptM [Pseudohongiella nitratireducens]|uniref:LPS translocon maturation chaperone LptM n=1 Tax=Pseudohongiella nitratireducens TaxID=1768907 RepID=UPI003C6DCBB4